MTEQTAVVPVSNRDLIERLTVFAGRARTLVVGDAESYAGALTTLQEVRTFIKELDENRKERTRPLDDRKKEIMAEYRPAEDALKAADYYLVQSTAKWQREQIEAQRKAEQAAREKAERERQKAEEKAEQYREQGREDKAQQWETKAAYTPAPVVPSRVPQSKGVSFRKVWKFEVVDASKIPAKFLVPDLARIGQAVDGLKDLAEETIPGIRAWCEEIPVTRRAS